MFGKLTKMDLTLYGLFGLSLAFIYFAVVVS